MTTTCKSILLLTCLCTASLVYGRGDAANTATNDVTIDTVSDAFTVGRADRSGTQGRAFTCSGVPGERQEKVHISAFITI